MQPQAAAARILPECPASADLEPGVATSPLAHRHAVPPQPPPPAVLASLGLSASPLRLTLQQPCMLASVGGKRSGAAAARPDVCAQSVTAGSNDRQPYRRGCILTCTHLVSVCPIDNSPALQWSAVSAMRAVEGYTNNLDAANHFPKPQHNLKALSMHSGGSAHIYCDQHTCRSIYVLKVQGQSHADASTTHTLHTSGRPQLPVAAGTSHLWPRVRAVAPACRPKQLLAAGAARREYSSAAACTVPAPGWPHAPWLC